MIQEKQERVTLFDHCKQLSDIIDENHPLVKLANSIDWKSIEEDLSKAYPSTTGHPNKPIRLMVGLHYLRYMFDLSDESIVWAYIENPYYQYFCGEKVFQHTFPIDRSSMSKFRERLKKKKLYKLLQETIKSGFQTKVIKPKSIEYAVIDSTVQEKNIAYPTDAKLYYKGIVLLAKLARRLNIRLRQSYIRAGKKLLIKYSRYNHAKQFRRKAATLKKLKIRLGRVLREIVRKSEEDGISLDLDARILLEQCQKLFDQKRNSKNKLYSFHEPHTACISKGKAHKRYEFGNKSTFITTTRECFIIHADAHEGNPYDGHTLKEALDKTNESVSDLFNKSIDYLFTDKGYRGHGYQGDTTVLIETSANKKRHKKLKRRSSIETVFSHTKQDHRMGRNFLIGEHGNLVNTIMAACGYNLRKIYNKFRKAFVKMLSVLFFMLFREQYRVQLVPNRA
ncbi:IS5-like element ISSlsp2 family transposase [Sulfurovum sp. NBC37-1]|uniref:IS5-like element ISSlsp2 family transposase n=1 Tax=Sulfurovum sp. (strain NBC37-1) TaxID=387093 RepID=UPI00015878A4|nr:IS5-like element ISSlsp2 family transposase [Sulfurovum sp. NBC37-1]BAF71397.1 transposase [Sulfurovum sp. NBC37-1]BAF73048.1 transposase [Sulfurovum sp. NBC37-1]